MALLHTVNKSPFEKSSLKSCIRIAAEGSSILLLEDGVYGAVKGTENSSMVSDAMGKIKVYVMGPDLDARGVNKDNLIDGINVVDYGGFVDLVAEHSATQSWL